MIILSTTRQFAEFANTTMFVYIDLLKKTQLKNVKHLSKTSDEYLKVRLFNCLIEEVDLLFKKKLINTTGKTINIKMSDAAGIALYKALLALPVPRDHFYFNRVRNLWIEILDRQIIK